MELTITYGPTPRWLDRPVQDSHDGIVHALVLIQELCAPEDTHKAVYVCYIPSFFYLS